MNARQPKKMLILNVLDILKRRTDAEHRLSQQDMVRILQREYAMTVDRKTVRRNLTDLMEYGYQIEYAESTRQGKTGEEESICTDWYLERDFSDAELRLLIDSLLFSKHIPYVQCKELIRKLEGLSNDYFRSHVRHVCSLPDSRPQNKELFLTIEVIDEAISRQRQISFVYSTYDIDKKLHPRQAKSGKKLEYLINPYQMVATNGKYYLICNYDKYDDMINLRLDRITEVRLLESPAKPLKSIRGFENGLDLPRHMAEHIYMFSGESVWVTFLAKRRIVTDIIDWFGGGVDFSGATEDEVTVKVKVNEEAMKLWLLQYAPHVRVLSPPSMVEEVRKSLAEALRKYG